jgi:hypothetical protein
MGLVKREMAIQHRASKNSRILRILKFIKTCRAGFSAGSLVFLSLADIALLIYPDSSF